MQWANHTRSLSLEEETKKKILARMEEKVSKGEGTWIDWQYLLDAVALLRKVHRTPAMTDGDYMLPVIVSLYPQIYLPLCLLYDGRQ